MCDILWSGPIEKDEEEKIVYICQIQQEITDIFLEQKMQNSF